jgi:hypothetical protein
MADLTTRRVIDKIDLDTTYMNAFTSGILGSARLPIALDNDRTALEKALDLVPNIKGIRMARIVNTGSLETFWATKALLPEFLNQKGITVHDKPLQLEFNDQGRLLPFTC